MTRRPALGIGQGVAAADDDLAPTRQAQSELVLPVPRSIGQRAQPLTDQGRDGRVVLGDLGQPFAHDVTELDVEDHLGRRIDGHEPALGIEGQDPG